MNDFTSLLDSSVEDAAPPVPLPAGSYIFNVKSWQQVESGKKKTPGVEFMCSPMQPLDDVDTEALVGVEGWQTKEMRLTFWITKDSMFRLKNFLEHCQIDSSGRTFSECIPEAINQQFVGNIEHTMSQDGQSVFANIGNTAAVQ